MQDYNQSSARIIPKIAQSWHFVEACKHKKVQTDGVKEYERASIPVHGKINKEISESG